MSLLSSCLFGQPGLNSILVRSPPGIYAIFALDLIQVSAIKGAMTERPVDPTEKSVRKDQLPIVPPDSCHRSHMERWAKAAKSIRSCDLPETPKKQLINFSCDFIVADTLLCAIWRLVTHTLYESHRLRWDQGKKRFS